MFESAYLKIARADHHIADLERQLASFFGTHPFIIRIGSAPRDGTIDLILSGEQLPSEFALIIGDAVHNLRTALDHLIWELVGIDGGTQDRYLKFPAGNNRINFTSACEGVKTPSQAIRDTLKAVEVFPSGKGDLLYALHLADNADKHTVLMPVVRAAQAGNSVDRFGIDAGGAAIKLNDGAHATLDVFFGEIGGVGGRQVVPTLRKLSHATANALHVIRRAIA